jgi:hypothetical protein
MIGVFAALSAKNEKVISYTPISNLKSTITNRLPTRYRRWF